MEAAKIISSSIVGSDVEVVILNNKRYTIPPPTIHRIAGAISFLTENNIPDKPTVREVLMTLASVTAISKALSFFIKGDDSIADELSHETYDKLVDSLEVAISMISTEVFLKAVNLAKSVARLAAKTKL